MSSSTSSTMGTAANAAAAAAAPTSATTTKKQQHITKFEQAEHVHRQLLYDLMSSIYEYVVVLTSHQNKNTGGSSDTATVTETGFQTNDTHTNTDQQRLTTPNIESLLIHINSCLEQIFLNGLRIFKPDVSI